MRIYEVMFDGREKDSDEWSVNWQREKVAIEDGGAVEAIALATKQVTHGHSYKTRVATVTVLAETSRH